MTGYVSGPDGRLWQLPPMTAWSLTRTDGTSADSYEVSFPYSTDDAGRLTQATRFCAAEGGRPYFTGVVDEALLSLDESGRSAQLSGRGLAALLMDNQSREAVYTNATIRDVLAAYVEPFGLPAIRNDIKNDISSFAVDTGDTCWQALSGFCRHAAERTPRFLADGTLDLTAPPNSVGLRIDGDVLAAGWRVCRYGVISEQVMVDRSSGEQRTAQNAAFVAAGGQCRQVTSLAGQTVRATARTAEQRIAEAARGWRTLSVTLPGLCEAEPCSLAAVSLPLLGVEGIFRVCEVTVRLDASGLRSTLDMKEE